MPVLCMVVICDLTNLIGYIQTIILVSNPNLLIMCLNPITIINPCKYVSLRYRERYLLQVPCGHCAQCATNKYNEWYFRSYHQTLDTFRNGGYVLFDTLTYRNLDLPHISDYVSVPVGCDYPCFSRRHLQLFNKRLRKYLQKYNSSYSYFIASEYGTSEKHTHRPHYHILIYSDGKVDALVLSKLVAKAWQYGRTDGLPYKSAYYVRQNVFDSSNFDSSLRTVRYVSKYVQKSCLFEREIQKRLDNIMLSISCKMLDGWLDSPHAKKVRSRYARLVGQFHLQSVGFGSSFLQNVDITDFDSINELWMPDATKVHYSIALPMYFKRKMYYDIYKIDGNDTWLPTKLGMQYLQYRNNKLVLDLDRRFKAACHQAKVDYDTKKLADYVLNYRGRIRSVNTLENPLDKYNTATIFNYVTLSDREHLDKLGLTPLFAGNNKLGYRYSKLFSRIKFKDFIARYVILDDELEIQLKTLYDSYTRVIDNAQKAYELRQHLVNLYHHLGIL